MEKWIVTGISGCGRIELLNELSEYAKTIDKEIVAHDVGGIIHDESERSGVGFSDQYILNRDQNLLRAIRVMAVKEINIHILKQPNIDIHFIGIHAIFRWKHRMIPGVSYADLRDIEPDGFLNVVNDVQKILETNKRNPKWEVDAVPDYVETQEWMNEEKFITELLAEVLGKPIFLIARQHNLPNLANLFFTNYKKIYLSYPISAIKDENPKLLDRIQGPILEELERHFVVFNPLAIGDMSLTYDESLAIPGTKLSKKAKELIKTRTIERDYKFIDQSDAVVVIYMTDKLSSGVISEVNYAHRNQKPVFMVLPSSFRSPFIEDIADSIHENVEDLISYLVKWAHQ